MRLAVLLLGAYCAVATGQNACLSDASKCTPGDTSITFQGCGITNADIPELESCLDTVGRSNIALLFLTNNELSTLPTDFFEEMGALTILGLTGNQFTSIPAGISGVESLNALFMGGNQVTSIYEDDLPQTLKELHLAENLVTSIDDIFFPPSLEYLILDDSDLHTISSSAFDNLGSLLELEMSYSSIESIEAGAFKDLVSLERINLRGNLLETLPSNLFAASEQLTYLDLAKNQLAKLPVDAFAGLSSAQKIYLHNNALTTLPEGILKDLGGGEDGSLFSLSLFDNPDLQCVPEVYLSENPFGSAAYTSVSDIDASLGICGCTPVDAVACPVGTTCAPGEEGYTCEED